MNCKNPKCWAHPLGGCGGRITGEHYVSKSTLTGRSLHIKGLSFCRQDFVEIPIGGAVANILCESHNSGMSPADHEAGKLRAALIDILNYEIPPGASPLHHPWLTSSIEGPLIKRWAAKTACNLFTMDGKPLPIHLVQCAFGLPTDKPVFLFGANQVGDKPGHERDNFHFASGTSNSGYFVVLLRFFGITWLMTDEDPRGKYDGVQIEGEPLIPTAALIESLRVIEKSFTLPNGPRVQAARILVNWPQP